MGYKSTASGFTDKNGNVYIGESFDSSYDFDPGPGVKKITSPFTDICIAKYSTDGNLLWVDDLRSANINSFAQVSGVVADNDGNVYITGVINDSIDFDPSLNEAVLQANFSENYVAAAYDANGNYKWSFKIDVNNFDHDEPRIAFGKNSVYLFGVIPNGTADLDPGSATHTAGTSGVGSSFAAKYNRSDGSYIWGFGLASDTYNSSKELAEDSLGNIILSGGYQTPIDLDPGPGTTTIPDYGVYLAKYKSDGSFIWGQQELIPGYHYFDPSSMKIDPQNNILRAGQDRELDPTSYVAVVKYNPNGSEIWDFKLSHSDSQGDFTGSLITDGSGNFYIAGGFLGTVDFDPGTGITNVTSAGSQDAFFAKYKDNTNTLPVTLLNFSGEINNKQNLLHWVTATELNNTGFEVQRSSDGNNFSKIDFVNTKAINGNSNSNLNYDFIDENYSSATNYYRLKQIDKDGKVSYSNIVVLKDNNALASSLSVVYPNPAKNILNVKIASQNDSKVTLLIIDINGKTLHKKVTNVGNGESIVQLNISDLSAGNYYLKLICTNGCENAVMKFVKQ